MESHSEYQATREIWIAQTRIPLKRLPATSMGRFHTDVQAAGMVKDAQFYSRWSKPYPLFCAWLGDFEFRRLYDGIEAHTVVSPDKSFGLSESSDKLSG